MTYDEAKQTGIDTAQLNSLYGRDFRENPDPLTFHPCPSNLGRSADRYWDHLSTDVCDHGKRWMRKRADLGGLAGIYFCEDGKVDYFLYDLKDSTLSAKKKNELRSFLSAYISTHKLELNCKAKLFYSIDPFYFSCYFYQPFTENYYKRHHRYPFR